MNITTCTAVVMLGWCIVKSIADQKDILQLLILIIHCSHRAKGQHYNYITHRLLMAIMTRTSKSILISINLST